MDCRRNRDHRGERYRFTGLLLEDMNVADLDEKEKELEAAAEMHL